MMINVSGADSNNPCRAMCVAHGLKAIHTAAISAVKSSLKIMRHILKRMFLGENLGDLTSLSNPESLGEIKNKLFDGKKN